MFAINEYLLTHNKKRIPLLNLLINCIPARAASQILSIKGYYTFVFLNWVMNSSTNFLLGIFSF